jgi:hypothetical protein
LFTGGGGGGGGGNPRSKNDAGVLLLTALDFGGRPRGRFVGEAGDFEALCALGDDDFDGRPFFLLGDDNVGKEVLILVGGLPLFVPPAGVLAGDGMI